MPESTHLNSLKINVLTKQQFNNAEKDPNQLYMITDEPEMQVVNNLVSTSTTDALSAAMGKSLKDAIDSITTDIGDMGGGDMMKASYDANNDGVVDDSEKLGGQLPQYYAKASDLNSKANQFHTHSIYVNQNAFSNVKIGTTTISADSTTDTLNIAAGNNITLTPNASNNQITIAATNTTYDIATTIKDGLMSSSDKTTLNDLSTKVGNESVQNQITSAISNKANVQHEHTVSEISDLTATANQLNVLDGITASTTELNYVDGVTSNIQTQLNGKAASQHGTHVTYSSTNPLMDGTVTAGTASTVARSDHRHPTDTSRASSSDLSSHVNDLVSHITNDERTQWNNTSTKIMSDFIVATHHEYQIDLESGQTHVSQYLVDTLEGYTSFVVINRGCNSLNAKIIQYLYECQSESCTSTWWIQNMSTSTITDINVHYDILWIKN